MSPPPRRWLDSPDAPPGAADLLRAAGAPDAAARARVWSAITASTPAAASATTVAARAAQLGAKAVAALGKQSVVATIVALGAVGARAVTRRAHVEAAPAAVVATAPARVAHAAPARPPRTVTAAPVSAAEAPVETLPTPVNTVSTAVTEHVVARAPSPPAAHPRATSLGHLGLRRAAPAVAEPAAPTLTEELSALSDARRSLDVDPARSLATLDALGARLRGHGVLSHERERYAIEALRRLGRTREALARAEAFLASSPGSTAAGPVRALRDALATNR